MSSLTIPPPIPDSLLALRRSQSSLVGAGLSALLTPIALLILGYHPYAEDGGLYLAGVKFLLNPALFPHLRQFVTAPLHYSAFAPCTAFLVRHSGLSFDHVVFILFLVCVWATIFGAWRISQACFFATYERIGATLLVALWMSLPVAGTSLMLIDPYLTARSFSTPLVLFGVAEALNSIAARKSGYPRVGKQKAALCALCIFVAILFHPLMGGYGAAFVLSAFMIEAPRPRSTAIKALSILASGLLVAASIQALSPTPSSAMTRVALTRTYWFLSQWEWFELLGLLAPLVILAAVVRFRSFPGFQAVARSSLIVGVTSVVISIGFARPHLTSFGVSHLQPLRVFQVIYFVLFLVLGAWLARIVLRNIWWRWIAAVIVLSIPVMVPGWLTFPYSPHIELRLHSKPSTGSNNWVSAFLWIRQQTPVDALFAIDADYISERGEDAQSFRAIAERSVLPDYSKDGGETAVNQSLSDAWSSGVDTQQRLSSQTDAVRNKKLRSLDVTWMVLRRDAITSSDCPYSNAAVKVCRVDPPQASALQP